LPAAEDASREAAGGRRRKARPYKRPDVTASSPLLILEVPLRCVKPGASLSYESLSAPPLANSSLQASPDDLDQNLRSLLAMAVGNCNLVSLHRRLERGKVCNAVVMDT